MPYIHLNQTERIIVEPSGPSESPDQYNLPEHREIRQTDVSKLL